MPVRITTLSARGDARGSSFTVPMPFAESAHAVRNDGAAELQLVSISNVQPATGRRWLVDRHHEADGCDHEEGREIDHLLQTHHELRDRVFEVHPEVSFATWNGGTPIAHSKHSKEGRAARRALVAAHFGQEALRGTMACLGMGAAMRRSWRSGSCIRLSVVGCRWTSHQQPTTDNRPPITPPHPRSARPCSPSGTAIR